MPELAKLIEVNGAPSAYTITIDGTDLPWYVLDGVTTTAKRGEQAALTISIPADKIIFDTDPKREADWLLVQAGTGEEIGHWSTTHAVCKGDIVQTSDDKCWRVESIAIARKLLRVSSD